MSVEPVILWVPQLKDYSCVADWLVALDRHRRRVQEDASAAHFAAHPTFIPDLEFLTPVCPVCDRPTDYDDGSFCCEVCYVTWPRSGYGLEAERDAS